MRILLACTLVFMAALVARGELVPDEVAIIAMSTSPQGKSLAEHYAKARGVPQANIFLLDGKPGLAMARTTWEQEARPAIRAWLSRSGLETKIRCFVTCWDVPLKIGRRDPNAPEVAARKEALAKAREALIGQIEEQFKALEAIAPGAAPPARSAPARGSRE